MSMEQQLRQAAEAIGTADKIVLACHINPDGDALGSILSLTHALRALGKDVVTLSADGVPAIYAWMPGAEWITTTTERRDFDLAIVCDAGALERVGRSVMPIIESAPLLMDIDHHVVMGSTFGTIQVLDDKAAATAELIFPLLRVLSDSIGRNLIDRAVADCLMTGIITDTGSFRFMNVTPQTFELSALLQRLGASPAVISELVFENRSFASLKLLGRALDVMQRTPDGRIAWTHIRAADLEEFDATDADTEGIVSHVRAIEGAQIGILFREIPGKKVRISLRARDGADVNLIANVFGGGGHKLASGCSVEPPLEEAERLVLAEAIRQLAAAPQ